MKKRVEISKTIFHPGDLIIHAIMGEGKVVKQEANCQYFCEFLKLDKTGFIECKCHEFYLKANGKGIN